MKAKQMDSLYYGMHKGQKRLASHIVNLTHKEILALCGRTWGKDTAEIVCAGDLIKEGYKIGIFCHSSDDCRKIFDQFKQMDSNNYYEYRESFPLKISHEKSKGYARFHTYKVAKNLRGKNFYNILFVNEASLLPNKDYYSAVQPITNTVKMTVYFGTAAPVEWFKNKFMQGQTENKFVWSIRAPSSQNAKINTPEVLARAKASLPPDIFKQEYECEFVDASGSVFPNVDSIFCLPSLAQPTKHNFFGVDIANEVDWTVIIGLNDRGEMFYYDRMQRCGYEEIIQRIVKPLKEFRGSSCQLEMSGVGNPIYQRVLQDVSGVSQVLGYGATNDANKIAMNELIFAVNSGALKVPSDFMDLREEMKNIKYKRLDSGKYKYEAADGFHDDIVDALMLANYCKSLLTPKR